MQKCRKLNKMFLKAINSVFDIRKGFDYLWLLRNQKEKITEITHK